MTLFYLAKSTRLRPLRPMGFGCTCECRISPPILGFFETQNLRTDFAKLIESVFLFSLELGR